MSLKTFQVGDKVMLNPNVEYFFHGKGLAKHGEVGVIKQIGSDGDLFVDFPNHPNWRARPEDLIPAETQAKEDKAMKRETTESPNETIVKIMWAKQIELGPTVNYFTVEDANDIMKWDGKEAAKILFVMKEYATNGVRLLGPSFCPFCIKHDFHRKRRPAYCGPCEYGGRHGRCPVDDHTDYRAADRLADSRGDELATPADILDRLGTSHKEKEKKEEKHQKPVQVKRFEDREPDDHPRQTYLRLESESGSYQVKLVLVDKDGDPVTAPNVAIIHHQGIARCEAVNPNAPFALDYNRRIVLDEY
jgi:hypothetical protein